MSKEPIVPPSWTPPESSRPGAAASLPTWMTIGGGTIAAVVLLRYAIDLLGLVLVLGLVGFSIRALSDWLTDGEKVSGLALCAAAVSLVGTVAIGVWLFDGRRVNASGVIERRVPPLVGRAIDWAERRGWGKRVLLPERTLGMPVPSARQSSERRPAPSLAIEIPAPPPEHSRERRAPRAAATAPVRSGAGSGSPRSPGYEPAAPNGLNATGARVYRRRELPPASAPAGDATAPAPAAASRVLQKTRTLLTNSPPSARVGTSVRLTARVETDEGPPPGGSVVFRRGETVLGTARLRPDGDAASGFLIVLSLPVGEHEIVAEYSGDDLHAPSRSASVRQAVVRR